MRRRQRRMEAPRHWQFSLSNWSVTRKVGIVLVLPVLLATAFAVLRINNELRTLETLDAATEQAIVIRPVVHYSTATEQLALAATAHAGTRNTESNTALTRFDQALTDLEAAVEHTEVDEKVTAELSSALAVGTTMRDNLRSDSPAMVSSQADEIGVRIGNALTSSPVVPDLTIQRYFNQLGTIHDARRLLTAQRIAISSPEQANDEGIRSRVLTAAGGERTMVQQYDQLLAEQTENLQPLLDAVKARVAAFSRDTADPADDPEVANSLRASADAYDLTAAQLMDTIDSALRINTISAQNSALRETAIVIAMLLAGLALALSVARTLVVPVRRLRHDALEVAHIMLPDELSVVRGGGATPEITPVAVHSADEIGQLARAVDEMHEQALNLAAEQARLRVQIGNMFETLSRRSQSLVEQQLSLIEELEHDEENTERLQSLFRLDHLATRMRRNGDNLLVLAGTALRRGQLLPVPLSDMLWSAVSQVEDYQRVEIGTVPDGVVPGEPAVDVEHLVAELIDNALRYSPPTTPVAVTVSRAVDGGYLVEITDRGLGMSTDDLQATNARLASGGEVTIETARRMGLFVVGRLAKRHGITAGLRRTSTMAQQPGITASVHLPGALIAPPLDDDQASGPQTGPLEPLPQPGNLVPVPSSGPHQPAKPVGVTSAGLPQRRTTVRAANTDESTSGPVPLHQPGEDTDSAGPPTAAFDIPAQLRTPANPPTGPQPVAPNEPEDQPTGLWSETHKTEAFEIPGFAADAPDSDIDSAQETATNAENTAPSPRGTESGLPIRQPVSDSGGRPTDEGAHTPPVTAQSSTTTTNTRLQPVEGEGPTPIYQRMVSEWLVEPATAEPNQSDEAAWSSPADAGWEAAEDASKPSSSDHTAGGLPIRKPGAQLVPGGLAIGEKENPRDPEEIRNNLTRHLSGVRSGRANAQHNDGGPA